MLKKTKTEKLNKVLALLKTNTDTNTDSKTQWKGGDWNSGYKCPEFFIAKGQGSLVDQGGILIRADEVLKKTGESKKGLVIEFENQPKAGSLIFKIATEISDKKYYIPWRFFEIDMNFSSIYFHNKTIMGSIFLDDKELYKYKIVLPYKYGFSDYISPEEGYKLTDAMKDNTSDNQANIKNAKSTLSQKANEYSNAKKVLTDLEKNKKGDDKLKAAQLQAFKVEQKKEEENNAALKAKNKAASEKRNELYGEYMQAQSIYDSFVWKLNNSNREIVLADKWIEKVKSGSETKALLDEKNTEAEKAMKASDTAYGQLMENAYERKIEINASKAGLKAEDKVKFQSNLDKIYP